MGDRKKIKKILKKHLKNMGVKKSDRKEIIKHSKRVRRICVRMVEDLGVTCDMPLLEASAMLHDIAKYGDDGEKQGKHHKKAKKIIEKYAGKRIDGIKVKDIGHVAKQHKGKFKPKRCVNESIVLRLADKKDRFNKYPNDYKGNVKSLNKSIGKIRRYLED